jgi:hypothetical protein
MTMRIRPERTAGLIRTIMNYFNGSALISDFSRTFNI